MLLAVTSAANRKLSPVPASLGRCGLEKTGACFGLRVQIRDVSFKPTLDRAIANVCEGLQRSDPAPETHLRPQIQRSGRADDHRVGPDHLRSLESMHRSSSGDFLPALEQFYGTTAGLSASTITRLVKQPSSSQGARGSRTDRTVACRTIATVSPRYAAACARRAVD